MQSEVDRTSLTEFFKATEGQESWKITEGWNEYIRGKGNVTKTINNRKDAGTKYALTSSNGSGIHGVLFDKMTSGVSKLMLPNNHLTGQIPKSLGYVNGLTQLVLNDNSLSGEVPAKLFRLVNLSVLFLQHNEFEGSIPSEIGLLSNLVLSLIHI